LGDSPNLVGSRVKILALERIGDLVQLLGRAAQRLDLFRGDRDAGIGRRGLYNCRRIDGRPWRRQRV
jgi:hypothetical protein